MLHPGRSNAARQSAQTHTGALAGDYDVMRPWSNGPASWSPIRSKNSSMCPIASCVARARPFGGVAIFSESGAYKALALDYCDGLGIALPQPQGDAEAALNAIAPGLIVASNPLDLTAQALVNPQPLCARAATI